MDVEFWFDPICPFCWATSRWLNDVAPERELEITWSPISLFFKNDPSPDSEYYEPSLRTLKMLRVVEAVRAQGGANRIGDLYTELGRHIHHRSELDVDVAEVLDRVGLDTRLADAMEDESWDDVIRSAMKRGLQLTGDDVGTPLIAFEADHGPVALFGPVIADVLDHADALRLWDGFVQVASVKGFYELKRTRDRAPELVDESVLDAQLTG